MVLRPSGSRRGDWQGRTIRTSEQTSNLLLENDRHLEAFRPIKLQKAADAVIAVVVDAIRGGLFCVGDLLPNERALAVQLQVSRTVVREAIGVLRREGILEVKRGPGGGISVVSDEHLRDVVAGLSGMTHDLMRWALEARRSLEVPAFLLAASRATDAELEALNELVEGLLDLADRPSDFYLLDQAFHREVVRLSRNPLLIQCYRMTLDELARIREEFPVLQVQFPQALDNQRTLYAALLSRRPDRIQAALDEHLSATEIIYIGTPISHATPIGELTAS